MADETIDSAAKGACAAAGALILTALVIDDGTVAWLVGFIVLALFLFAMSRVPIRHSLMGVMFFSLTLENPNEVPAGGLWSSPLMPLGRIMMMHLNISTGVSWMSVSGMDILLIFLLVLSQVRRITGNPIDGKCIPIPKPLKQLAYLSLAGTTVAWIWGMLRGGDFKVSLWQVEKVTYLPIIFLLFSVALRNVKDHLAFGRVFLAAAVSRSLLAIWIVTFADLKGKEVPWATTHHDSMLFACAIVILVSLVMHRAFPHAGKLALLLAPIIMWGMVANNRRTAWVQCMLVFVVLYFSTPISPLKTKVKKFALLLSPVWIGYIVVGWQVRKGIFKPVGSIRSVLEPATDMSTMTRDIENYCIARTIAAAPILGLGYGHQFFQLFPLPPMPHPLEPWLPHNSLLGLWFATGFVGYTSMSLLWIAGVYFGVRAYRMARHPMNKAVALVAYGSVLIYMIQCYADLGLGAVTAVFMVAPSLVISGQLAVATGAWVPKQPAKRPNVAAGQVSPSVHRA